MQHGDSPTCSPFSRWRSSSRSYFPCPTEYSRPGVVNSAPPRGTASPSPYACTTSPARRRSHRGPSHLVGASLSAQRCRLCGVDTLTPPHVHVSWSNHSSEVQRCHSLWSSSSSRFTRWSTGPFMSVRHSSPFRAWCRSGSRSGRQTPRRTPTGSWYTSSRRWARSRSWPVRTCSRYAGSTRRRRRTPTATSCGGPWRQPRSRPLPSWRSEVASHGSPPASPTGRARPMAELLLQLVESLRKTLTLASAEIFTGNGEVLDLVVSVPDRPTRSLHVTRDERQVISSRSVGDRHH